MRIPVLCAAMSLLAVSPVHAQGLRNALSELFIFGEGEEALFLGGSGNPDNPLTIQAHGAHFVPAAVEGNATIISFLTNSVAISVGSVPVSAASGGSTFRFEGGSPVRTSVSAGPVFGERAQTLGRGRLLVGLHRSGAAFQTLRGVNLDDVNLTFTHANVDFEGCDEAFGADCSEMGTPDTENATIDLQLALDVELTI